ncbi:hypothetical protein ACFL96_08370 [Thermoproteota archaeon]
MRIPKRYGQSKINKCPFCGIQATFQNPQKIPVCRKHKDFSLSEMRCVCGEPLDLMTGKFGPYFQCMNCGNINFRKGMEMNEGRIKKMRPPEIKKRKKKFEEVKSKIKKESEKTETVVTSDEVDFMFD